MFFQVFADEYTIYKTLCAPTDKLFLSYPVVDTAGKGLFRSRILAKLTKVFPKVKVRDLLLPELEDPYFRVTLQKPTFEYLIKVLRERREGKEVDEFWYEVERWYQNQPEWQKKLDWIAHTKMEQNGLQAPLQNDQMPEEFSLSVSRLEQFNRCPFSHFARYALDARPRQSVQLQSSDIGTLIHRIMEQLSKAVALKYSSWNEAEDEYIEVQTEEIATRLILELEQASDERASSRTWLFARLKRTAKAAISMMAFHLKQGNFIPLGYEISFSEHGKYLPVSFEIGGKKVKLRGKVDRADIFSDGEKKYIRIVDYKTGERKFSIGDLYYGLQIQLALYLDTICQAEEAAPAGNAVFQTVRSYCIHSSGSGGKGDWTG